MNATQPPQKRRPQPIQRRKLYQDVMQRIVQMIRGDGYAVGDQLPSERDLMDYFAVGRPAVREALQNLEWMGLITISHGERARIAQPSFGVLLDTVALTTSHILTNSDRSLDELKQARLLFEVQMVRIAVQKAGPDDIARLRQRHEDHRASLGDTARFLQCDMMFHREIATITGNALFSALSEAMIGWLGEFYQELVRVEGAEHVTLAEHQSIVEALAANDAEAAERTMTDHLTRASALYRQALETAPDRAPPE